MKKNFPPSTSVDKLNNLRDKMNELSATYPIFNQWANQFAISSNEIGNMSHCKFFVSDKNTRRGMAFSQAYYAAKQSKNNRELCAYVASMICDVSPGTKSSIEAALEGIGVKPIEVSLPSEASQHNIVLLSKYSLMDWPTILVYFGCCILLLFKKFTTDENYKKFMSNSISKMGGIAGCDPDHIGFYIPFDFVRANAITSMLGASSKLRSDAIKFLVGNIDNRDTAIASMCKFLCNKLSWSGMRHFTLVNDLLVKSKSSVLLDPQVSVEFDNLMEACEVIKSHPCPQFFMYLASNSDLQKLESSRFPNLVAYAVELERMNNRSSIVADSEAISTEGANRIIVRNLMANYFEA